VREPFDLPAVFGISCSDADFLFMAAIPTWQQFLVRRVHCREASYPHKASKATGLRIFFAVLAREIVAPAAWQSADSGRAFRPDAARPEWLNHSAESSLVAAAVTPDPVDGTVNNGFRFPKPRIKIVSRVTDPRSADKSRHCPIAIRDSSAFLRPTAFLR
jgi:hypothetical protein